MKAPSSTWILAGALAGLLWLAAHADGAGASSGAPEPAQGSTPAQGGGSQGAAPARGVDDGASKAMEELQERVARLQSATRPGPAHERLAALAGEWDVEVRYTLDPAADPLVLSGTCTNETILDGRFLTSASHWGEGPWEGESFYVFGHDARYGRYTLSAFDTAGTHSVQGAGSYDEATRTIHLPGTDWDPILGHTQVYSIDLRFVSADEYVVDFTFYDPAHAPDGAPAKLLELVHRRRK